MGPANEEEAAQDVSQRDLVRSEEPRQVQEVAAFATINIGAGRGDRDLPLSASASAPALKSSERRGLQAAKRSPLLDTLHCAKPVTDKWGFPKPLPSAPPAEPWNWRHHLLGVRNDDVPKGRRKYFSKPESLDELKEALQSNPAIKNAEGILQGLELGDLPGRPRSFITPDAGAPVCPERHVYGGTMLDRDGMGRTWNSRWHTGIAIINEHCHPDHRTYFTQRSLFERSPSQQYRRFLHQERKPGEWVSLDQRRSLWSAHPRSDAMMRPLHAFPASASIQNLTWAFQVDPRVSLVLPVR